MAADVHLPGFTPTCRHGSRCIPRRGTTEDIRWFEADPTFVLHFTNAYEDGDEIVLDGFFEGDRSRSNRVTGGQVGRRSGSWRWTGCRPGCTGGGSTWSPAGPGGAAVGQHHRVRDDQRGYAGRQYRYTYAATGKPGWFLFDGLVKHDLHTGGEQRYHVRGRRLRQRDGDGPTPETSGEDDGYLVTLTTDMNADALTAWCSTPPGSATARCANWLCRNVFPAGPTRPGWRAQSCVLRIPDRSLGKLDEFCDQRGAACRHPCQPHFARWDVGDRRPGDEDGAPQAPPPVTAWRGDNERRILDRAGDGGHPVLVMPAVVYGHGGGLIGQFIEAPGRTGAAHYIGAGDNRWTVVHVEDIAELYVAALACPAGGVYAGVDDSQSPTMRQIAEAVSVAAGHPGTASSITMEQARHEFGPLADAFALDQRFTAAHAHRVLGWTPAARDVLAELASDG